MTPRVSPTEQVRAEIDELFGRSEHQRQLGETLEEVARLGARLRHRDHLPRDRPDPRLRRQGELSLAAIPRVWREVWIPVHVDGYPDSRPQNAVPRDENMILQWLAHIGAARGTQAADEA